MLVHTKKEDGVHLLVIDQEQKWMVSFKFRMKQRSSRSEAKESSSSSSLTSFLIYLNK